MRTKIVCTLGPATDPEPVLREMIRAGMDVARVNFSHGTHDDHARRIEMVRRISREENRLVSVLGDLQGPKFRVGDVPAEGVKLARDRAVTLSSRSAFISSYEFTIVPLPHEDLIAAAAAGRRVLIDDGSIELVVISAPDNGSVLCRVVTGGTLLSHKGVAIPGARLAVASITDKDRADLQFAVSQKVDAVALSFVRSAADIRALRSILKDLNGDQLVVAKIEKPEAVDDLANILREVDIIMVARGDLGVEAPAEEVPFYQKKIIHSCLRAGVPVITATQMLQSMIHAPQPTRAEASDVANAVLDGTDAVMLSAETATGDYPVESVRALERIASRAERDCSADAFVSASSANLADANIPSPDATTEAITTAAVEVARLIGAKVIVCTTRSGFTARMVARHRPSTPVIVITSSARTYQFTAFMWDVRAVVMQNYDSVDAMFEAARQFVLAENHAQPGDRIVITAGAPLGGGSGKTNLIKVHTL
ncbi:MAG: pyruvate kinase [Chloroflexi bacterium]|nr:pyruvate kinase [Chloroflexota bacterium]MCL5274175.1 pyruvate kinase [Chloroflexota bacterium]